MAEGGTCDLLPASSESTQPKFASLEVGEFVVVVCCGDGCRTVTKGESQRKKEF